MSQDLSEPTVIEALKKKNLELKTSLEQVKANYKSLEQGAVKAIAIFDKACLDHPVIYNSKSPVAKATDELISGLNSGDIAYNEGKPLTVKQLVKMLKIVELLGHGDANIFVDTEAKAYNSHLAVVTSATVESMVLSSALNPVTSEKEEVKPLIMIHI